MRILAVWATVVSVEDRPLRHAPCSTRHQKIAPAGGQLRNRPLGGCSFNRPLGGCSFNLSEFVVAYFFVDGAPPARARSRPS